MGQSLRLNVTIRRISLDIEVETDGRLPDAKIADKKVTAVGFEGSDGMKKVFVFLTIQFF